MNLEQAGTFIKLIYEYQTTGKIPEDLDFGISMAIEPFILQFKRDEEKYKNVVERNRNNGAKGGRPSTQEPKESKENPNNPVGFIENQEEPKKAVNNNDTIKESDNVTVIDSVSKKENDKELTLALEVPIVEAKKKIPYQEIVDVYHSVCIKSPKVQKLTTLRKNLISKMVKEYGLEKIGDVFRIVSNSDFLNGINERGWTADFEWILTEKNFVKILEGKYKTNSNGQQKSTAEQFRDAYNSEAARNFKFS